MAKVVHIKKAPYDVYIGRKNASSTHYGNPFSHLQNSLASVKVATQEEAVRAYWQWLVGIAYQDVEPARHIWILENLASLEDKVLGCFCAGRDGLDVEDLPWSCHGQVLIALLNTKPT